MPELPEVETHRSVIEDGALNRTITRLTLGNDTTHMELPEAADRARFEGRQLGQVRRHGKYLFAGVAGGPWLALHLGMAGSVRLFDEDEGRPDYARLIVEFEGARRLAFRDPRKFGWVRVIDAPEDEIAARKLGPDALDLDDATFAARIGSGKGAVKSALLNQSKLAGIGNLWADEALFQCALHPSTRVCDVPGERMAALAQANRRILSAVCDVSARYQNLPEAWLIHRRKDGASCSRCDGAIDKTKVGGRTSFYCPQHQTHS